MTLTERLDTALASAGVGAENRAAWRERIFALPFDRAEVFVFILERIEKRDIVFLNKNLKDKIEFSRGGLSAAFDKILAEEKLYLLND